MGGAAVLHVELDPHRVGVTAPGHPPGVHWLLVRERWEVPDTAIHVSDTGGVLVDRQTARPLVWVDLVECAKFAPGADDKDSPSTPATPAETEEHGQRSED